MPATEVLRIIDRILERSDIRIKHLERLEARIFTQGKTIMEELDKLNAKMEALGAKAQAANDKADALIAGEQTLSAQVTDLQTLVAQLKAAGGASPEDLDAISAKADAISAGLDDQIAQDDAALNPAPAPTPPAEPPVEPPADPTPPVAPTA